MQKIIHDFMNNVTCKNPDEKEFLQAVEEVAETVIPFIEENLLIALSLSITTVCLPGHFFFENCDFLDTGIGNEFSKRFFETSSLLHHCLGRFL